MSQRKKFRLAEMGTNKTSGGSAGAIAGSNARATASSSVRANAISKAANSNARMAVGGETAGKEKGAATGKRPGGGKGNAARNEAARSAIIEALFSLMESERFSSISVSQITGEAGVARMSYYRNFESKEQVIEAYVDRLHGELIAESEASAASAQGVDGLLGEQALVHGFEHSLKRMRVEKRKILALINSGFATTLQRMVDGYLEERLGDMPAKSIERYELYFASGALLNVLVRWLEQGAKEPPEEMAAFCARLLRDGLNAK